MPSALDVASASKQLRVNTAGTAYELFTPTPKFTDLVDGVGTYVGNAGNVITVRSDETGLTVRQYVDRTTKLYDMPSSLVVGDAGKVLTLKSDASGYQLT